MPFCDDELTLKAEAICVVPAKFIVAEIGVAEPVGVHDTVAVGGEVSWPVELNVCITPAVYAKVGAAAVSAVL